MNSSPLLRRLALIAVMALVPVAAGVALATPGLGLTPTIIARGTSAETFSVEGATHKAKIQRSRAIIACGLDRQCDFVFQTITYQPGGHTGWHSHPGVLFVTVESGAVTRYESNCERNTYAAGQSFIERGPEQVILVRNEGSTPAKLQIAYVVPAGTANAALRIDQPAPEGCNPMQ
jgi:quercetin dioxygenase-like cupin family protein